MEHISQSEIAMLCFHQFPPSAFQAPPSSSELVAQLGVEQLKVNLTPEIATCEESTLFNLHPKSKRLLGGDLAGTGSLGSRRTGTSIRGAHPSWYGLIDVCLALGKNTCSPTFFSMQTISKHMKTCFCRVEIHVSRIWAVLFGKDVFNDFVMT